MAAELRVGTSGWRYREWRGPFYPTGLRQRDELAYVASLLGSVEINGSFYSLQRPSSYQAWREQTPDDFVFAVKGGRFITHMKKLRDVDQALANFFASGVLCLGPKLGPIVWQFPQNMPADLARFEAFFQLLPRDAASARRLARKHADWLTERSHVAARGVPRLRHAVELRNPACATREFMALLRAHDIGLVIADTAGRFPYFEDVTSDFVYVRLHGATELYASQYGAKALRHWARRIETWAAGAEPADALRVGARARKRARRDVYVYFDNDRYAHAPRDAVALQAALGERMPTRRAG